MKKILSLILALLMFMSAFPLFVFAEDEIPEGYSYVATYYYDKDNPYSTSVHGNTDYLYTCYDTLDDVTDFYKCIFIHNGKVVKDEAVIEALAKMYLANNWKKQPGAVDNVNKAKIFIEISDDLKLNSFIDGIATLASECLGKLTSIYFTGGSSTTGTEILKVIANQIVDDLKESLFDVSNIISELHLTMLHKTADKMEDCLSQIRAMNPSGSEFMYYTYCEEFCNVFKELESLTAAEKILISKKVEELEPGLIENLAHYFGIAANSFVGGFAEFLGDLDKIEELKNTNPEIIAAAIELADAANDLNETLTDIEDFKNLFDNTNDEVKKLFDIFDAYDAYEDGYTLGVANSVKLIVSYALRTASSYKELEEENNSNNNSTGNDTNNDSSNNSESGSTSGSTSGGNSSSSSTTSGSAPSITQSEVEQKISQLVSLLDYKYFTTNQISCGNNKCDYCFNANVFSSSWFKNMFGNVSVNQIPEQAYPNGVNGTQAGWTCHGFANFAMWYIFSSSNSDYVTSKRIVDNVKLTKDNLQKYAKPGDVIRYSNHSVVLISINDTTFTVLDCNAQLSGDGYARVRKHSYSYSGLENYTMAISRATNYDTSSSLSVNYNANGGSIPEATVIGEIYTVTYEYGINVRAEADETSTDVGGFDMNESIVVTEKKAGTNFTWGKINFNGSVAWIAIDSGGVTKTGTAYDRPYCVNDNQIFKTRSSSVYTKTYTYGGAADDLDDAADFGLYRDGYTFLGWSLSATGGELIPQDKNLTAHDLVPTANGNQTVTVYAVWEQDIPPVTDLTVEKIYLSSIPQKDIYYIGDVIDKSSIKVIVEHTDGTIEEVSSGFVCTPSVVMTEGSQTVTVTYEGKTATFDIVATKSKTIANNAVAKIKTTGYLLPDSSSGTICNEGAWANDVMQILCKDGNYYLCLSPWFEQTTATKDNLILLYYKADDITLTTGENIPSAEEYFSMNPTGEANATVLTNTKIYYRPDGGAKTVVCGSQTIAEATATTGTRVRVLFEMEGYYCVQTDKNTGFMSKSAIELDPVAYTLEATPAEITVQKGETIDTSSIALKAISTDGSETEVSVQDCTLALPDTDTAGQKKAVITYKDLSALIDVTVNEEIITVKTVEIATAPTKTSYYVGDTLSLDGLTLKVTYSDNTSETVSEGFTCATSTLTAAGKQTVSVEYEGKTVSFEITVSEKVSNATTIKIGEAETSAGETVSVDISIEKNPGVAVLSMTLNYDKTALTLKDVKNGEIFSSLDSDVNLFWSADSDSTEDGVLATLTFEVNENAEAKDYVISARINEAINENYEDQVFSVSNGKITVYDFIYGDVNGDGEVGAADVLMLRKYMANYDYDTGSSTVVLGPRS